jgi:polysaccharide export outer membrane protein
MFKLGGSNLRKLAATSAAVAFVLCSGLAGCSGVPAAPQEVTLSAADAAGDYRIGPLDQLQVFVWRAPDLSVNVHVRPDGKITIPLVEDLAAAGKTATELAREIEREL